MQLKIPQTAGIYLIKNKVNGKVYVGESLNIRNRMYYHKNSSKRPSKGLFVNALRKYGWDSFKFSVLENIARATKLKLLERETFWIKFFDSTNREKGYNILINGCGREGYVMSQATKEKIRQANFKRDYSFLHKSVAQIDIITKKTIKVWDSARIAAIQIAGNQTLGGNISNICRGYKDENGVVRKTAMGFGWRFV